MSEPTEPSTSPLGRQTCLKATSPKQGEGGVGNHPSVAVQAASSPRNYVITYEPQGRQQRRVVLEPKLGNQRGSQPRICTTSYMYCFVHVLSMCYVAHHGRHPRSCDTVGRGRAQPSVTPWPGQAITSRCFVEPAQTPCWKYTANKVPTTFINIV